MQPITSLLNLSGFRRLPLVRQAEAAECGLACLAMIAGSHGYRVDLLTLRRRFPTSLTGIRLKDLIAIAAQIGLGGRALRCGLTDLYKLRTPCILHWEFKHFVVLKKVRGDKVWIHDPAVGARVCKLGDISGEFTGVALELTPTKDFQRKVEKTPVKLSDLWTWGHGILASGLQGLLLSLLLELFVLLTPFYSQLVIDEAILKQDADLLIGLATAFAIVALFSTAASALRSLVFQYLATVVSFDMEARLFHHMIRLPLDFFQKRSLGELLQRFHALEPVKAFIVNGGITALLDGSLAIFTGALMLVYSPMLGGIAVGVFLIYAATRVAVLSFSRRLAADAMVADAREQTSFIETIRAVQTIKVGGGEVNRETSWRNLYAEKLNAGFRIGNLGIAYSGLNGVLSALSDVGLMYLAARMAIRGDMTIGVITAFMAYKGQFMGKMMSLVDQAIQYKMLSVQLERVGDIALTEREVGTEISPLYDHQISGRITLKQIDFRYSPTDRWIVRKLDFDVPAGSFVAIAGASGVGKSTLLKLMIGLFQPDDGEVLIDGNPLRSVGSATLRRQLGVVMQEDQLLAGSLIENIALFDDRPDLQRIRTAAQLAAIDAEIMTLPMQYHSLIGDMGTTLSSGQKQRVLIARALYREPKILVLDEGTAHIDPLAESQILGVLQNLRMTRVVVAHSFAMMRAARFLFEFREGQLHPVQLQPVADAVPLRVPETAIQGA